MQFVSQNIGLMQKEFVSFLMNVPEEKLVAKEPGRWSAKEIIGHLIDSALHNLVRFTESQYQPQPYMYRDYDQNALVLINDYQNQPTEDLLVLWLSLNGRISKVIEWLPESSLESKILLTDGKMVTIKYLITDYGQHLNHHLNHIKQLCK